MAQGDLLEDENGNLVEDLTTGSIVEDGAAGNSCCWLEAYYCLPADDQQPTGMVAPMTDVDTTKAYFLGDTGDPGRCVFFQLPKITCPTGYTILDVATDLTEYDDCDDCIDNEEDTEEEIPDGDECADFLSWSISFTVTQRLNNPPFTQQCMENGTSTDLDPQFDTACGGYVTLTCQNNTPPTLDKWAVTVNTGGGNNSSGFFERNPNGAWADITLVTGGLHYTFSNITVTAV